MGRIKRTVQIVEMDEDTVDTKLDHLDRDVSALSKRVFGAGQE